MLNKPDTQLGRIVFGPEITGAANVPSVTTFQNVSAALDLDQAVWADLKNAITASPRFAQMFAAGGVIEDAIHDIKQWLTNSRETV
jgi:hypothetical protein